MRMRLDSLQQETEGDRSRQSPFMSQSAELGFGVYAGCTSFKELLHESNECFNDSENRETHATIESRDQWPLRSQ